MYKKEKPSKEALIQEYIIKNKSAKEIAKELNLSEITIRRLLKIYSIQKDNNSRCICISKTKQSRTQEEINAEVAKARQTFLKKYGVDSPMKTQEIKDKLKQAFLAKYGVDNPTKVVAIKEKIAKTNKWKYGAENPFASDKIKNKIVETNLNKYGATNPMQCKEIRDKAAKKYHYNGISFDSSWELAFYIYHADLGEEIQREKTSFKYEYQGKTHKYFVDFTVNAVNYEIKSDYLFRYMITHKESIEYAKYECMLRHNVVILQAKDLKKCLAYVSKKYGKDFLQSHRNN